VFMGTDRRDTAAGSHASPASARAIAAAMAASFLTGCSYP
jgi:hypothetical protein